MTRVRFGVVLALLALLPAFAAGGATVSGRVYVAKENRGLGGLILKLVPPSPEGMRYVATTQPDGTYRFEGVRPGHYELQLLQNLRRVASASLEVQGNTTYNFPLDWQQAPH